MSSYQQLLSQKAALAKQQAELDKQLVAAQRAERANAIARIKAMMAEYDLTLQDLGFKASSPKVADGKTRRKVAIKYRNPATGESWTGRGLQPKWLTAALAKGKKLEDFVV